MITLHLINLSSWFSRRNFYSILILPRISLKSVSPNRLSVATVKYPTAAQKASCLNDCADSSLKGSGCGLYEIVRNSRVISPPISKSG